MKSWYGARLRRDYADSQTVEVIFGYETIFEIWRIQWLLVSRW